MHNTICNCLLKDKVDKLVYMYCNEKFLLHIESKEYEEDIPRWMYNCNDAKDEHFDVGLMLCTPIELEQKS